MEKKYLKKVVTIKLRNQTRFQGVVKAYAEKWTLLKFIPVDYVIDGLVFINNKHISSINISEDDIFTEKVVKLKKDIIRSNFKFTLLNDKELFHSIKKKVNLIKIELKEQDKTYIGKIIEIGENSVRILLLSPKCKWLNEGDFLFSKIRAVYIEDDYLNSLQLFLDKNSDLTPTPATAPQVL